MMTIHLRSFTIAIIIIGILSGLCLAILSMLFPLGSTSNVILSNIGSGLIATAFISLILDIFWTKERVEAEREEIQPFLNEFKRFVERLDILEGRLEAFKQLGLNYCHSSRKAALRSFLVYANDLIGAIPGDKNCVDCRGTINIVSSSARGLMGYLDRDVREDEKAWRDLITKHPKNFRILLTHPAYAHLRQPAEERSSGDIELEILKTAVYLHCVANMTQNELRFYRGSPTVFLVQIKKHILLNPYPYGKMAMETLCMEFESENENSYVADFVNKHFNHTWEFIHQDSKLVDGMPLVEKINDFVDILKAFSECTFLGKPNQLRLTTSQVKELDTFTSKTLPEKHGTVVNNPPSPEPFTKYVKEHKMIFCEGCDEMELSQPGEIKIFSTNNNA